MYETTTFKSTWTNKYEKIEKKLFQREFLLIIKMFQQVGILFNTCDKIDFKLSMKSNFTGSSKASIWPLLALLPISSDYRHLKFLPDIIFDKINGILG